MFFTYVIGTGLDEVTARHLDRISTRFPNFLPVDAEQESRWRNREGARDFEIGLGAAGCLLAHEKIWKKIADQKAIRNQLFLVLEDDATLTRYGRIWIDQVQSKAECSRLDLVHLGRTPSGQKSSMGCFSRKALSGITEAMALMLPPRFFPGFAWRTHSYLVSSRMASHLANMQLDFTKPIDQHLRENSTVFGALKKFRVVTSYPALFLQTDRDSLVEARGR